MVQETNWGLGHLTVYVTSNKIRHTYSR